VHKPQFVHISLENDPATDPKRWKTIEDMDVSEKETQLIQFYNIRFENLIGYVEQNLLSL